MARPHAPQKRRCSGHSKRTGKRCEAWAIRGGTVCVSHGGAAPQVIAAAERNVALEEAQRMVARAGVSMDPLEHLLDSLQRAYQLVQVFGAMVAAIDDVAEAEAVERGVSRGELSYFEAGEDSRDELRVLSADRMLALNRSGEAQLHPYMVEYRRWSEMRAKFAKMCVDAGIAEKLLVLGQRQVEIAHRAFEAMLEEQGLSATKRQEARRIYARHLRAV